MKFGLNHRFVFYLFVTICPLSCFLPSASPGCVYTVRDIGFVDVRPAPYHLYCYVREETPEKLALALRRTAYVTFMDSNVEVGIINIDNQKSHPAIAYLRFWGIRSFPSAVLVSPDGRSMVLSLSTPNKPLKDSVWSVLEGIVSSPKRDEILRHIVRAYCVVLLVEGGNAIRNRMAREAVADAVGEIARTMGQMTKTVEEPPHLIVIPAESFPEERILLWSLGIDDAETGGPYVAVLYGRGRRIGPLLEGEDITRSAVFNILSVIGSACECGLDREWVLGKMIPLRWDEGIQSEVVRLLGFDAESPMVKTEMGQILSLGPSRGTADGESTELGKGSIDEYREKAFEGGGILSAATISPARIQNLSTPETSPLRTVLLVAGAVALLILIGGIFVLKMRRERP